MPVVIAGFLHALKGKSIRFDPVYRVKFFLFSEKRRQIARKRSEDPKKDPAKNLKHASFSSGNSSQKVVGGRRRIFSGSGMKRRNFPGLYTKKTELKTSFK